MPQPSRIDLRIPPVWRRELDELSQQSGLSAADLGRLAVRFLLDHKDRLVGITNDKKGAGK